MIKKNVGTVGDWIFVEAKSHGFGGEYSERALYGYAPNTITNSHDPQIGEWYPSIEHAMAAAIAEKYTGRRGAGGTGVGTAADWFMRMIGAE